MIYFTRTDYVFFLDKFEKEGMTKKQARDKVSIMKQTMKEGLKQLKEKGATEKDLKTYFYEEFAKLREQR